MRMSKKGIALLKRFEGLRLVAYYDIAAIPTIGYGHTESVTAEDVAIGRRITIEEAERLLRMDLRPRESAVIRLVSVSLNRNEFDALVSFVYNVGVDAFKMSTARKRLNRGDRVGSAQALTWWNKATIGGELKEVDGLKNRRAAEQELFLTPLDNTERDQCNDSCVVAEPGASAELSTRSITAPVGANPRNRSHDCGLFGD